MQYFDNFAVNLYGIKLCRHVVVIAALGKGLEYPFPMQSNLSLSCGHVILVDVGDRVL